MISIGSIVSIVSAVLGLAFFLYYTLSCYINRRKYAHIPGPQCKGLFGFYFGNLDKVFALLKNEQTILADIMGQWNHEFGSVFKFQFLNKTVIFTTEPDAVKEILVTRNFQKITSVYKNAGYPFQERFLGRGLITDLDPNRWRERRAKFNPAFNRTALATFLDEFNFRSDMLTKRIRENANTNTCVVMLDEFNNLALDIIATIAFGMHVDNINNPNSELKSLVFQSLKGLYISTFDPFIMYKPHKWGFINRYKKVVKKLRMVGKNQILDRVSSLKYNDHVPNDILTSLLQSHSNETVDIEDLIDDFVTYFVAGQETTANTLAFTFLELARNPRVLIKLRQEIDNVIGSRTTITLDDLANLTYTNCVYKETLRLWPPIPEIGREINYDNTKEFKINGFKIPNGSWLQVSSYISARNPDHFDNPCAFIPERFLADAEKTIKNYTYFPFSLGPRNCIGQNFAQMLGKVVIAKLVANFDFKLDPSQNLGVKQEATLRPFDGTKLYFKSRD